ncbi:MAG: hypothetical protein ACYDFT_01285 [Thermoplasmata archaeon]
MFLEASGLPSGMIWSVTLNGAGATSTTGTFPFAEPNGSYTFRAAAGSGFSASPAAEPVRVYGSSIRVAIAFTRPGAT